MLDLTKLIEQWENSALELREAESLINLLIVDNRRLEKLLTSNNQHPNQVDSVCASCFACDYAKSAKHKFCYNCGKPTGQDCSQHINLKEQS